MMSRAVIPKKSICNSVRSKSFTSKPIVQELEKMLMEQRVASHYHPGHVPFQEGF